MNDSKRSFHFSQIGLSTLLTAVMVACQPPADKGKSKNEGGVSGISVLSEKMAACEIRLRAKMLQKAIPLQQISELSSQINEGNQLASVPTKSTFQVIQKKQQNSELQIQHLGQPGAETKALRYNLRLGDSDSQDPFVLETTYLKISNGQSALELSQKFLVSEACAPRLVSTTRKSIVRAGDRAPSKFQVDHLTIYDQDERKHEQDTFVIPEGALLANTISDNVDSFQNFPNNSFVYIDQAGLYATVKAALPPKTVHAFEKDLYLDCEQLQFLQDQKVALVLNFCINKSLDLQFREVGQTKTWTVPQELWSQQKLGVTPVDGTTLEFGLPKDYFKENHSVEFWAKSMPSYDHFSAYWRTDQTETDPATQMFRMTLNENSGRTVIGKTSAQDLEINSTIQSDLPEIEAIVQQIKTEAGSDRSKQISGILKYLKDNYSYDYEMLRNNVIGPLTTQEALARHKGVCQHYAVIYTAIARGLKIPTRIVIGYLFYGAKPGLHAWVESEMRPQLWQVIEPQLKEGLTQTEVRYYFPLARGLSLENKDLKDTLALWNAINIPMALRPTKH